MTYWKLWLSNLTRINISYLSKQKGGFPRWPIFCFLARFYIILRGELCNWEDASSPPPPQNCFYFESFTFGIRTMILTCDVHTWYIYYQSCSFYSCLPPKLVRVATQVFKDVKVNPTKCITVRWSLWTISSKHLMSLLSSHFSQNVAKNKLIRPAEIFQVDVKASHRNERRASFKNMVEQKKIFSKSNN